MSYKPRNDLCIYKSYEIESSFIEISNSKKANVIVGCIYRHPSMSLSEFNDHYLKKLLDRLSRENKSIFLLGDFNVNLLNYDTDTNTNEFLDSLTTHSFISHIIQPTRVRPQSKTLIDNIFSNIFSPNIISGNLTATVSDHLPQFVIVPHVFENPPNQKSNIYERDWSTFDKNNVTLDYFAIDWNDILQTEKGDINKSLENFLNSFNSLLDRYAPLKKVPRYKLRFRDKPWITLGIQKSIQIKNKYFTRYINLKYLDKKMEMHILYKNYRNLISTLLKRKQKIIFLQIFSR